jgi:hypothetical protein
MTDPLRDVVGSLSGRQLAVWGLVLAGAIELVTVILRFGMKLQATRDTSMLASWTFGFRIHHGYIGVVLLLLALPASGWLRNLLVIIGIGLVLSDLAHHFLVLWPITGSPEFDIRYPTKGD